MRSDGRKPDELRPVKITRNFIKFAQGSVLIEVGDTRVICTASVVDGVPEFLIDSGQGWITAEYAMLPASTGTRRDREGRRGRADGRSVEIQRLIGRALRAVVDLTPLGARTIWVDCDVIQADGGTRTASITGAYVALMDALNWMKQNEMIEVVPVMSNVAAVSVGLVEGEPLLDLNYEEDAQAQVDMNIVMTGEGKFVEIQGTAEQGSFDDEQLRAMIDLAKKGIAELSKIQKDALEGS